jgi:hypothetical protein
MLINILKRLYYQYKPHRASMCPVTIHALLHIVDSIEQCGPVWCYWCFAMERYSGNRISGVIGSKRFPWADLDRRVLEDAQLTQIKVYYNKVKELSFFHPKQLPKGSVESPQCT